MPADAMLTDASRSIGHELEHARLEHRARRVTLVLTCLRQLADARSRNGCVPAPLRRSIAGFTQELAAIDRRLAEF